MYLDSYFDIIRQRKTIKFYKSLYSNHKKLKFLSCTVTIITVTTLLQIVLVFLLVVFISQQKYLKIIMLIHKFKYNSTCLQETTYFKF